MERLSTAELAAQLALPSGPDELARHTVVEVVADPGGASVDPSVPERLAGVPALVLADAAAESPVASLADVVVERSRRDEVTSAVVANPQASVALAMLVRGQSRRSLLEDLLAESTTYAMLQAGPEHRAWLEEQSHRHAPAGGAVPVGVERDGDVLRLTLQRPAARNAFDAAMRDGLVEALGIAAADPALTVVLEGAGPGFCSGGDLGEFGTGPDPVSCDLIRLRRSVGRAIALVAERTTVRVHGACVGAGVEIPAFAGRVVARPDATFRLPELAMGLVPGAGGTASIARRVGRQRFVSLALTGATVDAETALSWGLVDEIEAPRS